MKTNDILVTAYPKSGITYFGFLLTAARLKMSGIRLVPTFYNIDWLLIDLHKMGQIEHADIWNDGVGNLCKSHLGVTGWPNVIYVLRNPVDCIKSHYHFAKTLGDPRPIADFVIHETQAWITHVEGWLLDNRTASQSIFVTRYEDLVNKPRDELCMIGEQFGMRFSREALNWAVAHSSKVVMRHRENTFAARNPVYSRFNLGFVGTGAREVDGFKDHIPYIEQQACPAYELVLSRLK